MTFLIEKFIYLIELIVIFLIFLGVFNLILEHFFPSSFQKLWVYIYLKYIINYFKLTDYEKVDFFKKLDYHRLVVMRRYLFELFKDKKDDKLLLRLIDLRHIFPIIPNGTDASDILRKLLFEDYDYDYFYNYDSSESMSCDEIELSEDKQEKIFWWLFYLQIRLYRGDLT